MTKYIRTLSVIYDLPIAHSEIPLFRGAVLKTLEGKADLLFHNHTGENSFRYAYPLIQYKRLGGKAAIVCVDKAVDIIGQFLTKFSGELTIGEKKVNATVSQIIPNRLLVQTWQTMFQYHITNWLALNTKNYLLYQKTTNDVERRLLLEGILKGNLLSMLKGLDIHLETELQLEIIRLSIPHVLYNKGVGFTTFNADFQCNLSIPRNVGIGKNASIGYGKIGIVNKKEAHQQ